MKGAFYQWSNSIQVFDPWDHFSFADEAYKAKEAMDIDIYHLVRSDLVVVNFDCDPKSIGTACELAIAYDKRIPILALYNHNYDLHDWLASMPSVFFDSSRNDVYKQVASYICKQYLVRA